RSHLRDPSLAFLEHHQPTPNPPLICGIKIDGTSNSTPSKKSAVICALICVNLREPLFFLPKQSV
ncbi:MAG TPA: hypothetical protein VF646_00725, partial [Cytophagales bacterium]